MTRELGRLLGEAVCPGAVVLLSGDLGAGKTCFAQGVAVGLGIPSSTPVTSPSYSLMNIYEGRMPFYHFDLYRLSRIDDLTDLGYDEFAGQQGLTLVEWADRVSESLEANLSIVIDKEAPQQRRLFFEAHDPSGVQILAALGKGIRASCSLVLNPPEKP